MVGRLVSWMLLPAIILLSTASHLVAGDAELLAKLREMHSGAKQAMEKGDLNKAEDLLHEMIHIYLEKNLNNCITYAVLFWDLSNIYAITGDYPRAVAKKKTEALEIVKTFKGDKEDEYIKGIRELAQIHLVQGDYATAEQTYRAAYRLQDSGRFLPAFELGVLNALRGNTQEAGKLLMSIKVAVETSKQGTESTGEIFGLKYRCTQTEEFDFSPQERITYKLALTLLYAQQGSYQKSTSLLRELVKTSRPFTSQELWEPLAWEKIGSCYYLAGKYDEAKLAFQKSLSTRTKVLPYNHPVLIRTMKAYASTLSKTGNKVAAAKIRDCIKRKIRIPDNL
jgi:tetratricopeptide (TPR) repeat protein